MGRPNSTAPKGLPRTSNLGTSKTQGHLQLSPRQLGCLGIYDTAFKPRERSSLAAMGRDTRWLQGLHSESRSSAQGSSTDRAKCPACPGDGPEPSRCNDMALGCICTVLAQEFRSRGSDMVIPGMVNAGMRRCQSMDNNLQPARIVPFKVLTTPASDEATLMAHIHG